VAGARVAPTCSFRSPSSVVWLPLQAGIVMVMSDEGKNITPTTNIAEAIQEPK
jgi:hypothetical protein